MQTTKKSFIPTMPRTVAYSYSLANKNIPKKKNAAVQTNKSVLPFEELLELNTILKDDFTFDETTKKTYSMAVDYINSVHSFMNKKLYEKYGESGDMKPETNKFFKLPDIPNYSTVYSMFLEKTKPPQSTEEIYNAFRKKENSIKTDFDKQKCITKTSVIEFIPDIKTRTVEKKGNGINICEMTLPLHFETIEDTDSDFVLSKEPAEFHSTHTEENINYVKQVVIYSKKNSFSEEERVLGSNFESEFCNSITDQECNSFYNEIEAEDERKEVIYEEQNFNDILHKPQENEDYSYRNTNNINDTDTDDNLEKQSIMDVIKQRVQEEFLTYLNTTNLNKANNEKKARLVKSNFHGVNIQPQINLFEYAQKKLERKHNFERETKSAESDRPRNYKTILSCRNSINIKPSTPEKVTNLFRKISQERFSCADVESGERRHHFPSYDTQSDNDSVILDDEEFEKMSKCCFREEMKIEETEIKKNPVSDQNYEKSHPLKLNGKDMTKLNEKVLSAIGLFTERGDIRPGIIDILEEEKRAKAKDSRNKQFRGRRQWDLQIHLKPKTEKLDCSLTSVSTEKSFISLSSDIKSDFETVKNISQQMQNLRK